jgi:hypothetical protein
MPGFMPGIHVFFCDQDADGRAMVIMGCHDKIAFSERGDMDWTAKI